MRKETNVLEILMGCLALIGIIGAFLAMIHVKTNGYPPQPVVEKKEEKEINFYLPPITSPAHPYYPSFFGGE